MHSKREHDAWSPSVHDATRDAPALALAGEKDGRNDATGPVRVEKRAIRVAGAVESEKLLHQVQVKTTTKS